MNDRLEYLEGQIKHYERLLLLTPVVFLLMLVDSLFLGITYWYHAFTNDGMTTTQLFKWSIGEYWYLYLGFFIGYWYVKSFYPSINNTLNSFKRQYQKEVEARAR